MPSVFLLHFDKPYRHARHFLDVTDKPVEDRLAAHLGHSDYEGDASYGRPAKLLLAAREAGCTWVLADVWEVPTLRDAFQLERKLKRQGGHSRLCSICSPRNHRGNGRGNWPRVKED